MHYKTLLAGCFAFAAAHSAVAITPEQEELLKPCVGCHGTDGIGTAAKTPHINWQVPAYLKDTMRQLQNGERPTAVPKHIPKTWTTADLQTIADLYGKDRTPRPKPVADASKIARGSEIHLDRCDTCHPDNGRESDDRSGAASPTLAGQPAEYILAQERHYAAGKRKYAHKADKAHEKLTDADLEAVSHFYASQDIQPPAAAGKKRRPR